MAHEYISDIYAQIHIYIYICIYNYIYIYINELRIRVSDYLEAQSCLLCNYIIVITHLIIRKKSRSLQVDFWQVGLFEWTSRLVFSNGMVSWNEPMTHAKGCWEEKYTLQCWCSGVKPNLGQQRGSGGCSIVSLLLGWGMLWIWPSQ